MQKIESALAPTASDQCVKWVRYLREYEFRDGEGASALDARKGDRWWHFDPASGHVWLARQTPGGYSKRHRRVRRSFPVSCVRRRMLRRRSVRLDPESSPQACLCLRPAARQASENARRVEISATIRAFSKTRPDDHFRKARMADDRAGGPRRRVVGEHMGVRGDLFGVDLDPAG